MLLLTLLLCGNSFSHEITSFDPMAEYGSVASYSISRNGKPIGKHTLEFSRTDDSTLLVDIATNLQVRFLGIPVYKFEYLAQEKWLAGQLQIVTANTTEKGTSSTVSMKRGDSGMLLQNKKGTISREVLEHCSNHWNPEILRVSRIFNTLSGKANTVKITAIGNEELSINGKLQNTTHYRYSGELRVDVWYDERQRWVKLKFNADDGSAIIYLSMGFPT